MSSTTSPHNDNPFPYEPQARFGHCSGIIDGKMYSWGGYYGPDHTHEGPPAFVKMLNLVTNKWQQLLTHGTPPPGFVNMAFATVGHSLFTYGGQDMNGDYFNSLHFLNSLTMNWSLLEPINPSEGPTAKANATMIAFGRLLLLYGGFCDMPQHPSSRAEYIPNPDMDNKKGWTNELHCFDIDKKTWSSPTTTGSPPPPCQGCSLTQVDEHRALHFGGEQLDRLVPSHIHILNLQSWTWIRVQASDGQPWPVGRAYHSTISLYDVDTHPSDPALLVMWGLGEGEVLSDAWKFQLNAQEWQKVILPDSLRGRFLHTTCVLHCDSVQKKLVAYGGIYELSEDAESTVPVAETTIVELKHTAPSGDWVVTKVIPTSELLEQPKESKDSLPKHVQMTLEEEMSHLTVCDRVIREKGKLELTVVQCMASGAPRAGKSTLLSRLTGKEIQMVLPIALEAPDLLQQSTPPIEAGVSPSTGIAERVLAVTVTVKRAKMFVATVFQSGSTWELLSIDEEAIGLLKAATHAHTSQMLAVSSTTNANPAHASSGKVGASVDAPTTPHEGPLTESGGHTSGFKMLFRFGRRGKSQVPALSTNVAAFKPPLEIFKEALRNEKWSDVQSFLEGSFTIYFTDTGGQPEFQELLPALIAGPSVFFLVFKLTDNLHQKYEVQYMHSTGRKAQPYESSFTVKESLMQSLASIASTCMYTSHSAKEAIAIRPKVVIVGTHEDQATPEQIAAVQRELDDTLRTTEYYTNDVLFYPKRNEPVVTVNNLSPTGEDAQKVRTIVERIAADPSFRVQIPLPWLVLSLALRLLKVPAISRDECFSIATECGIESDEELDEALWFLHTKLGVLRYFKDVGGLRDIVILDPQLIFEKATNLSYETFTFEQAGPHAEERFRTQGIFSADTVARLAATSSELLTSTKLVKLLEHLHLLASITSEEKVVEYFMPSVLTHAATDKAVNETASIVPPLIVKFKCGYCPKGMFSSIVVFLLSPRKELKIKWQLQKLGMSRDRVSFNVGRELHAVSISMKSTHLTITIHPTTEASKAQLQLSPHEICDSIRGCIDTAITTVSQTLHYGSKVERYYGFHCSCQQPGRCNDPDPVTMTCDQCGPQDLSPLQQLWFGLPLQHSLDHPLLKPKGAIQGACVVAAKPELKELVLIKVKQWYDLGLQLDIDDEDLDTIEEDNPKDTKACKRKMFRVWLKTNPQASYDQIARALIVIGEKTEAVHICEKYGIPCPKIDTA